MAALRLVKGKPSSGLKARINNDAVKLWGITDDELKAIQEALAETRSPKRAKNESEDSADDVDG